MILHDFMCLQCNHVEEFLVDRDTEVMECPKCQHIMKITFLRSGGHRLPDDTPWLKTVLEVVDKDAGPDKPHTREFLRNPTRENYHNWMKENGIRPLEDNERPRRKTESEARMDRKAMAKTLLRNHMARNAITVRTR